LREFVVLSKTTVVPFRDLICHHASPEVQPSLIPTKLFKVIESTAVLSLQATILSIRIVPTAGADKAIKATDNMAEFRAAPLS
jgi:hypothetical protein